ncbi:unnamed protein product [Camellia sinensis]
MVYYLETIRISTTEKQNKRVGVLEVPSSSFKLMKNSTYLKGVKHVVDLCVAPGSWSQVSAAGDLCAICQEKMHAPILLRCKHIFCEDCVSEWFESLTRGNDFT